MSHHLTARDVDFLIGTDDREVGDNTGYAGPRGEEEHNDTRAYVIVAAGRGVGFALLRRRAVCYRIRGG
ncbi:MAG: hypothetical protein ACR2HZ_08715 [Gemmatimonadaceae bacterium]